MTINDMAKFVDALWDWGFLNECFGKTGIKVTDMDGVVERNGRFLAIEAKGPQVQMKNGQIRHFRALAATGWTIVLVWGEQNKPERMAVWRPHEVWADKPIRATAQDIQDVVRTWFEEADASVSKP